MSDENCDALSGFSRLLTNTLQMMVKHIYFGNISKKDAQKSIKKFVSAITSGGASYEIDSIKEWASEYLGNCTTRKSGIYWHDLRKNKDDLPVTESSQSQYSKTVLNEQMDKVFYDYENDEWKEPVFGEVQRTPVLWTYIPEMKFLTEDVDD